MIFIKCLCTYVQNTKKKTRIKTISPTSDCISKVQLNYQLCRRNVVLSLFGATIQSVTNRTSYIGVLMYLFWSYNPKCYE